MHLITPLTHAQLSKLNAGDEVTLTGTIYTARDQAHKRMVEAVRQGRPLPVALEGQAVYYCGPTARRPGMSIGSCGPTTSSRMDEFTPVLLAHGLKAMIGKGARSAQAVAAIKKAQAVYFLAYAGCGALLTKYVTRSGPVAYKELGPEAIFKLEVENFPLIVGVDSRGKSVY